MPPGEYLLDEENVWGELIFYCMLKPTVCPSFVFILATHLPPHLLPRPRTNGHWHRPPSSRVNGRSLPLLHPASWQCHPNPHLAHPPSLNNRVCNSRRMISLAVEAATQQPRLPRPFPRRLLPSRLSSSPSRTSRRLHLPPPRIHSPRLRSLNLPPRWERPTDNNRRLRLPRIPSLLLRPRPPVLHHRPLLPWPTAQTAPPRP